LPTWALRLLAALSVALAVTLAWAWVEGFYSGVQVNERLVWSAHDQPVLVVDQVRSAGPIIGQHWFGDFQVPWSYARDLRHGLSPYLRPAPGQYPPLSQLLFVPLSLLPLHVAVWTYLVLSVVLFLVPLWLLLAPSSPESRIIFLVPAAVLTTGFVSFLDRGNSIGITVGLLAWTLWAWRRERWVWCGVFLVAAIALKAYPAALLVVPFALRRYKFVVAVAVTAVAGNLVLLAFYPGGYGRNLRSIWPALKGGDTPLIQLISWSLYSVIPKTSGLVLGPLHVAQLLQPDTPAVWLPSVAYVVGLFVVIRRGRVPQWCWGPLALATTQLLVPVSFVYTTAWASVAAVWFARGRLVDANDAAGDREPYVLLRILVLVSLVVTLSPSIFTVSGRGGFAVPVAMYLSPILLMVTLAAAVAYSFGASSSPASAQRPEPVEATSGGRSAS
jgi:hypothetical protein